MTYSHPHNANDSCVQKLRETHCPYGKTGVAKQPFHITVKSRPRPVNYRRLFELSSFRATYKLYVCDEEELEKRGKFTMFTGS